MPKLSDAGQKAIKDALDAATDPANKDGVQGLIFCAIDKGGNYLTKQVSGVRAKKSNAEVDTPFSAVSEKVTLDTVFWIASCTKMVVGIAALQLVEQGKLELEDSASLYKVLPELKDKQVLEDNGKLVPKQREITLRMLLDHTAGFGYSFFNYKLRDWNRPIGLDELSGLGDDCLSAPLVNQPGSRWEYGTNIDWAGLAVERVSGMKLDAYFKKHIFQPLGIENISFVPSAHMRENLITCLQRWPDGAVTNIDHPFRRALIPSEAGSAGYFHSGGAGCFAKPVEYCLILAALLNDGTSPNTGAKILKPETVDLMMKNSIPDMPNYSRQGIPAAKPGWTNPLPEMYPQEGNPPQGWGLTFMQTIEKGPTGRGENTVWWAGIINCFWWVDRTKGVAGFIGGQILPFGDGTVMGTWGACEAAVYSHLEG